jgi:hypothetical protein
MHFETSEKRTTSLQWTQWLVPKCPLFGGSTVHYDSYRSECLVRCQVLRRDVVLLAGRTGELVLAEILLDATIAIALPAAGDDDGVLHQLLADVADQFRGGLHLLGNLLRRLFAFLFVVLNGFPETRKSGLVTMNFLIR